jgi:hypothetical protein
VVALRLFAVPGLRLKLLPGLPFSLQNRTAKSRCATQALSREAGAIPLPFEDGKTAKPRLFGDHEGSATRPLSVAIESAHPP